MEVEILEAASIIWDIRNNNQKCCQICKTYETPQWRRLPNYYTVLCNRCAISSVRAIRLTTPK